MQRNRINSRATLCIAAFFVFGSPAFSQVSVLYEPTEVVSGVASDVTVSIRNDGDIDLDITGVVFSFIAPDSVSLDGFRWLSGFDEEPRWVHAETFPDPQTASFDVGVSVLAGATLDVAVVTLTATGGGASMTVDLTVIADEANAGIFEGSNIAPVDILSGRDVTLTLTTDSGMGSDGGGDGGGGGGGSGVDPGNGGNGNSSDGGDSNMNDNGTVGDPDGDGGSDNSNGDGGDGGGDSNDGGTGGGDAGANDNGGDQGMGDDGADNDNSSSDGGMSNPPVAPCGMAMLPYALFTLSILSVMKLMDRRRA